ncbi:MAG: type II and III secretion system protein [Treponema sp.]|nr:type II and III secretion system protein [Treponema sp.]
MFIKKNKVRILALIFKLIFLPLSSVHGEEAYEFVDRDIHEMLYALSLYTGISISADDTVSGKVDFRCTGENFEQSFEAFLLQSRLYVEKGEKRWIVSRVRIQKNNELYSLDAFDVSPMQLFEKMAISTGLCITYDSLPQVKVSLHTGFCSPEDIFKRITGLCMGFSIEKNEDSSFHVARNSQNGSAAMGKAFFAERDGFWYVDITNASLSFALEKFLTQAKKEYCFALSSDAKIFRSAFKAENFDQALSIICAQGGAEFSLQDHVYLFYSSKNKNQISRSGKSWVKYELKFLKPSSALSLLAKRFPEVECILLEGKSSFLYLADGEKSLEIAAFLDDCDKKNPLRLVQLKFIRTEDFLSHLPPYLDKGNFLSSGLSDSFFFLGSEEAYENLLKEIPLWDKPVSRVRYDILIMQYQSSKGSEWNPKFKIGRMQYGDMNDAALQLGSVLNLNLDVVGAFGLHFAGELQSAISQSKAKVFADTTLNGISGKAINFQNTNTYRYRDNNLDPETGEPIYSGITKEIVSGLKLEILPTVSGDGMITSKITASLSRQGTDLSTSTGNPPPTSEKVITTEVRAKSGEPVVLSGLVQEEESENLSRTPFLSRLPIIGWFFKARENSTEKTELVIYLLPQAEIFESQQISQKEKNLIMKEKILSVAVSAEKGEAANGE